MRVPPTLSRHVLIVVSCMSFKYSQCNDYYNIGKSGFWLLF